MQTITPYNLKPGDHFRFEMNVRGEFVFTKISNGLLYCDQITPIQAWCWFDMAADPDYVKIVKIES
jgi:hypothetical protein